MIVGKIEELVRLVKMSVGGKKAKDSTARYLGLSTCARKAFLHDEDSLSWLVEMVQEDKRSLVDVDAPLCHMSSSAFSAHDTAELYEHQLSI